VLALPEGVAAGSTLLYTDPSLASFRAAGMKHGALRTFSPMAIASTLRAAKAGFRQHGTAGNPWQQGGALVVERGGKVRWSYSSDDPGDHVPVADALAALGAQPQPAQPHPA
jgi:hypothetical protein